MPQHFELSVRPLGHLPHPTDVQDTRPPGTKLKVTRGYPITLISTFPHLDITFPSIPWLVTLAPSHGSLTLDEPSWQSCYQGPNLNTYEKR